MNGRIQIRQIVVVDPTTLLLMILNQLDGLSDNIAYPEKAEEASQVYITSLEGDLGNFAAKEHAKGVNRQHESWLFVRYVGKDDKVEKYGVREVRALIFAPSLVNVIETA